MHVLYLCFSGGCFQTPTCIDQSNYNMTDIHEEGDELFTMIVPNATDQFSGHIFNDLFFSIVNSNLDIFNINSVTGKYFWVITLLTVVNYSPVMIFQY